MISAEEYASRHTFSLNFVALIKSKVGRKEIVAVGEDHDLRRLRENLEEGDGRFKDPCPDTSLKGGYGRCLYIFVAVGDWTIRVRGIATPHENRIICVSIRTKSIKSWQNLADKISFIRVFSSSFESYPSSLSPYHYPSTQANSKPPADYPRSLPGSADYDGLLLIFKIRFITPRER